MSQSASDSGKTLVRTIATKGTTPKPPSRAEPNRFSTRSFLPITMLRADNLVRKGGQHSTTCGHCSRPRERIEDHGLGFNSTRSLGKRTIPHTTARLWPRSLWGELLEI